MFLEGVVKMSEIQGSEKDSAREKTFHKLGKLSPNGRAGKSRGKRPLGTLCHDNSMIPPPITLCNTPYTASAGPGAG